jgi:hypothetical protein
MANRNGEKAGWLCGWLGSFLWVLVLAIVWVAQDEPLAAALGFFVFLVALILIVMFAPWRNPAVMLWKLMLPIYLIFLGAVIWAIWSFGGPTGSGLSWWNFFLILPVLVPLWTVGNRSWQDSGS